MSDDQTAGRGATGPGEPVIESASATTSPDNSDSGPLAYVVTGVVVLLLVLMVSGFSGCAAAMGRLAAGSVSGVAGDGFGTALPEDWPDPEGLDDLGELDHLLDRDVHRLSAARGR